MKESRDMKLAKTMLNVLMRARVLHYMHGKSNHIYTVWQHLILLAFRQYEGKSYRRFRPNIVVEPSPFVKDFVENSWVHRTLLIGEEVRLRITNPSTRYVMATLAQGDLPRDLGILRTAASYNQVKWGSTLQWNTVGTSSEEILSGWNEQAWLFLSMLKDMTALS